MFFSPKKKKTQNSLIERSYAFLNKLGFFKQTTFRERHAIHFLNISQFLGVVNDNFFKYLIVFLFIHLRGIAESPVILTWVGIVYVLPFLLFSSAAGILADRFSKQEMIIFLKFTEIIIMVLGIVAFLFQSDWASYTLLFLLSLQSAAFGPPKYSVIPELVSPTEIPKANGLVTSFTYLGIIFGTFLASFLTQITDKNFPLAAGVGVVIALFGFISSLLIPKTTPKGSKKRVNPLFVVEITHSLSQAKKVPYLIVAILGSASFLFIGAYFQLNIIPYAVQTLNLTEVAGGYLFLITAVGIACGAFLGGRLSKIRPELGLACLGGVAMAGTLFVLGFFPGSWIYTFTSLFALGVFGGLYIVPFDSFIQRFSPEIIRGQTVAATNFLSFCGVLIAPLLLFLFSQILNLKASYGFIITAVIILTMVLLISSKLWSYLLSYTIRLILKPFIKLDLENKWSDSPEKFVIILHKYTLFHLLLLSAAIPTLKIYFPKGEAHIFKLFIPSKTYPLHPEVAPEFLMAKIEQDYMKGKTPCICLPSPKRVNENETNRWLSKLKNFTLVYSKTNGNKTRSLNFSTKPF